MDGTPDFRGARSYASDHSRRKLPGERSSLRRRIWEHYPRFCRTLDTAVRMLQASFCYPDSCFPASSRTMAFASPLGACMDLIWGKREGETKNPPCQSARRVSETFCELYQLFSSFLRGASCPKSPRVAATAASLFILENAGDVKRKAYSINLSLHNENSITTILWLAASNTTGQGTSSAEPSAGSPSGTRPFGQYSFWSIFVPKQPR